MMGNNSGNAAAQKEIEELIKSNKIMVFSKSWCPYCKAVKNIFNELGVDYKVLELDKRADESDMQDTLCTLTGARSVPRVFINSKFVGGGDETGKLHRQGKLMQMIQQEA